MPYSDTKDSPGRTWLIAMVVGLCVTWGSVPLSTAGEFYEPEGVALRGYDPVVYFVERKAVKGSSRYPVIYLGSLFHFASAEHRDAFVENPQRYAPQYGGFCAFGVARGYKAKGDPEAFTVVSDKLYLNYSLSVRERWQGELPDIIRRGDQRWPSVSQQTNVIE